MLQLITSDGKCGSVLYLFEREAGADSGHAGDAGEVIEDEALVGGDIRDDDAEQIIGVTGHQVAFHDLGAFEDGFFEALSAIGLFFEADLDEDADRQTHRGGFEQGDAAADIPSSSSCWTRRRQGEGDRATLRARSTLEMAASSCRILRILRSVESSSCFGMSSRI